MNNPIVMELYNIFDALGFLLLDLILEVLEKVRVNLIMV